MPEVTVPLDPFQIDAVEPNGPLVETWNANGGRTSYHAYLHLQNAQDTSRGDVQPQVPGIQFIPGTFATPNQFDVPLQRDRLWGRFLPVSRRVIRISELQLYIPWTSSGVARQLELSTATRTEPIQRWAYAGPIASLCFWNEISIFGNQETPVSPPVGGGQWGATRTDPNATVVLEQNLTTGQCRGTLGASVIPVPTLLPYLSGSFLVDLPPIDGSRPSPQTTFVFRDVAVKISSPELARLRFP